MLATAATTTRRLLLARAITATAIDNPASAARVEVRMSVAARSGIAALRNKAVPDRLFGIAINIPTASAAMSWSTSAYVS